MPETPTPRLGLYRPMSDGSENVNVLTDLNNNLDKIDSYMGFQVQPTQAARFAMTNAYVGMAVRQADTGALYVLTALPASAAGNWLALQTGTELPIVVANQAGRDAQVGTNGAAVWRTDRKWMEIHDGTAWRVQGVPVVSSVADLAAITNPAPGAVAWNTNDVKMYAYSSGAWVRQSAGAMIAYGSRSSNTASSTAGEIGVLRVDNIQVIANRRYYTVVSAGFYNGNSNEFVTGRLRYSTAGAATLTSTQIGAEVPVVSNNFTAQGFTVSGSFVPAASGTASVLLSIARLTGTGSIRSNGFTEMPIFDGGVDPGNTGVAL